MTLRIPRTAVCAVLAAFSLIAIAQPAAQPALQPYVGQYKIGEGSGGVLSVYLEGGKLYMETGRDPRHELALETADHFKLTDMTKEEGPPAELVFVHDASGAIVNVKLETGSGDKAKVIFEAPRTSAEGKRLNHFFDYTKSEAMIPMRDGVKLHAVIVRPAQDMGPLPFLMQRTPYGVDHYNSNTVNSAKPDLAQSGYIWVFEDIRGRYGLKASSS